MYLLNGISPMMPTALPTETIPSDSTHRGLKSVLYMVHTLYFAGFCVYQNTYYIKTWCKFYAIHLDIGIGSSSHTFLFG